MTCVWWDVKPYSIYLPRKFIFGMEVPIQNV